MKSHAPRMADKNKNTGKYKEERKMTDTAHFFKYKLLDTVHRPIVY